MKVLQVGNVAYGVECRKEDTNTIIAFKVIDSTTEKSLFYKEYAVRTSLFETLGILKMANASLNLPVFEQVGNLLGVEVGMVYKYLFDTIQYENEKVEFFKTLNPFVEENPEEE